MRLADLREGRGRASLRRSTQPAPTGPILAAAAGVRGRRPGRGRPSRRDQPGPPGPSGARAEAGGLRSGGVAERRRARWTPPWPNRTGSRFAPWGFRSGRSRDSMPICRTIPKSAGDALPRNGTRKRFANVPLAQRETLARSVTPRPWPSATGKNSGARCAWPKAAATGSIWPTTTISTSPAIRRWWPLPPPLSPARGPPPRPRRSSPAGNRLTPGWWSACAAGTGFPTGCCGAAATPPIARSWETSRRRASSSWPTGSSTTAWWRGFCATVPAGSASRISTWAGWRRCWRARPARAGS